jgi:NADP-dependent 3-hydroxy acid dehydrogenase YdfG
VIGRGRIAISGKELRGRVAIITGASSGIGAATALACGAAGMRLALAARRAELLQEVAAQVGAAGGKALTCATDVREPEQIDALVAATLERYGRVDVLVANAGIGYSGRLDRVTDEQILTTVGINLLGVIRCARAVLPPMLAQRSGHILTVSSVAAGIAMPRAAVYAATKAGVHRFAEGLRRELRPHNIQVTDVLPGVIDTPMTGRVRGIRKAPAAVAAQAIVNAIRRPRGVVVTPAWYRAVLLLNRALPGVIDAASGRYGREEE